MKNKNGKSKSCLEMSNSLIENARTSKFENVCFCGQPNVYRYKNINRKINVYRYIDRCIYACRNRWKNAYCM